MNLCTFLDQFKFFLNQTMAELIQEGHLPPHVHRSLGIEREFFLVDGNGCPVPHAVAFLKSMPSAIDYQGWFEQGLMGMGFILEEPWTYELSACQVEHRTQPCETIDELRAVLIESTREGHAIADHIGLRLRALEVAPADMPLDVYPDDKRYAHLAETLPRETLRAACRVAGTHIHRECGDIEEAIRVHNALTRSLEEFMRIGDHSHGERLRLYREMAPRWRPPLYESPEHFHAVAHEQGFEDNPRNCWHLIRISRHGTVEVRAFGVTDDIEEIISWAKRVQEIANSA